MARFCFRLRSRPCGAWVRHGRRCQTSSFVDGFGARPVCPGCVAHGWAQAVPPHFVALREWCRTGPHVNSPGRRRAPFSRTTWAAWLTSTSLKLCASPAARPRPQSACVRRRRFVRPYAGKRIVYLTVWDLGREGCSRGVRCTLPKLPPREVRCQLEE